MTVCGDLSISRCPLGDRPRSRVMFCFRPCFVDENQSSPIFGRLFFAPRPAALGDIRAVLFRSMKMCPT